MRGPMTRGGCWWLAALATESPTGDALDTDRFADNDGWYDDTSDGIVNATITLPVDGEKKAESARVIVAPFDFAPEIDSFITLHDVLPGRNRRKVEDPSFSNTNAAINELLPRLAADPASHQGLPLSTPRQCAEMWSKSTAFNEGGPLFPYLSDPTAIGPKPDPPKRRRRFMFAVCWSRMWPTPILLAQHKTPREVRCRACTTTKIRLARCCLLT